MDGEDYKSERGDGEPYFATAFLKTKNAMGVMVADNVSSLSGTKVPPNLLSREMLYKSRQDINRKPVGRRRCIIKAASMYLLHEMVSTPF